MNNPLESLKRSWEKDPITFAFATWLICMGASSLIKAADTLRVHRAIDKTVDKMSKKK